MNNDSLLVGKVLKGEVEFFSILVQKYQKQIYNFLFKLTFSKQDTDEILQETFIRAYNYIYRYNDKFSFSSWLYKIALNAFKTYYKKQKELKKFEHCEELPEELCSFEPTPEQEFFKKEDYLQMLKLINFLKEDQKKILMLKYVEGISYKEIGKLLVITPEAAKMKVQRIKRNLGERYCELRKRGVLDEMQIQ